LIENRPEKKFQRNDGKRKRSTARFEVRQISVAVAQRRHCEAAMVYEPTARRWLLVDPWSASVSVKWVVGESLAK
jgi:hypothetical protein